MYEFLEYRVEDVMTSEVVAIPRTATLDEVERLFEIHGYNGFPVTLPDGTLLGWVTQIDLMKAFRFTADRPLPPYEEIMSGPVENVMSREVEGTSRGRPLPRVLELMVRNRTKSLPVLEEGKLVGVIARADVLRGIHRAVEHSRFKQAETAGSTDN